MTIETITCAITDEGTSQVTTLASGFYNEELLLSKEDENISPYIIFTNLEVFDQLMTVIDIEKGILCRGVEYVYVM